MLLLFPLSTWAAGGDHGGHGTGSAGAPAYAEKVNWHTLAEGREKALRLRKPMVVDFAVPEGCERCDFLEENVYSRSEIVDKINADFVPIWINLDGKAHSMTEEERKLGEKFDYRSDCLLLFLDYTGEIIQDPDGKQLCFALEVEPEDFIRYLDYVRTDYVPAPGVR